MLIIIIPATHTSIWKMADQVIHLSLKMEKNT